MRHTVLVLCSFLAVAVANAFCGGSPSMPSPLPNDVWGGDHITLTIGGTSTRVELDCAHGDIAGPFTIVANGGFSLAGTFVREHGGPIREDETPDAHPAAYTGSVASGQMKLAIRATDGNEVLGTFALTRGAPGRVVKCL